MSSDQILKLFLHMPKCGGTSVRAAIERLGAPPLRLDYNSYFRMPIDERLKLIGEAGRAGGPALSEGVIFGHFFPIKYKALIDSVDYRLVTILREPIQRLISHYRFWASGKFADHYLWRKMKSEDWSFHDFAFSPEMRNFYSQHLIGVGVERFSYIGVYEDLERSTRRCLDVLGCGAAVLDLQKINVTNSELTIKISESSLMELRDFHADDYSIYDHAVRTNSKRV